MAMLKARMTDLNMNEILMYLGHRGQTVTPQVEEQIYRCMEEVKRYAVPRLVYSRLPVTDSAGDKAVGGAAGIAGGTVVGGAAGITGDKAVGGAAGIADEKVTDRATGITGKAEEDRGEGGCLSGTGEKKRMMLSEKTLPGTVEKEFACGRLTLGKEIQSLPTEGNDIQELLKPCREAVLLAVTLGSQIEHLLMRREVTDMAEAVILDSCASVAVENVCDCFEEDMRSQTEQEGLFLSSRFSPGYGDFPLDTQKRLCEVLNTSRRIGLTVTENFLMVPRKSVTAVMGISSEPFMLRSRGCESCNMFLNCSFRKRGTVCHE